GGLGRSTPSAEDLPLEPVVVLVQVQVPDQLVRPVEAQALRVPPEAESLRAYSLGAIRDVLVERPERDRHLDRDPPASELAPGLDVRTRAIAQRLDHQVV